MKRLWILCLLSVAATPIYSPKYKEQVLSWRHVPVVKMPKRMPPIFRAAPPPLVTFNIYQGRQSMAFTNKVNVGYPKVSGTNYAATISTPAGTNFFVVTALDTHTALESDYSPQLMAVTSDSVPLAWSWFQPYNPKPIVVVLSAAGNSYTITNPIGIQNYRLLGLSMTSAVLVASGNLKGPWVKLPAAPTFIYPPQRTPDLIITRQ